MTPEDLVLDRHLVLSQQPLTLYRIARARYANLSGAGAAQEPGRWNKPGQQAIYTSINVSTPVLERLVHTPKDRIPTNLALMVISIAGGWEPVGNALVYEGTRGYIQVCSTLQEGRQHFLSDDVLLRGDGPFALAIPSVIVPAWNVVLYPQERGFWDHVALANIESFRFDSRLFPKTALSEEP